VSGLPMWPLAPKMRILDRVGLVVIDILKFQNECSCGSGAGMGIFPWETLYLMRGYVDQSC
jgi:hypothetical protein